MASPSRSGSVAMYRASALEAAFFSSSSTFFFAGSTRYSGLKLFFSSTPSLDFGRSRTCPIEAFTTYLGSRYFWIVLTLAGDSTTTSDRFATGFALRLIRVRSERTACPRAAGRDHPARAPATAPRRAPIRARSARSRRRSSAARRRTRRAPRRLRPTRRNPPGHRRCGRSPRHGLTHSRQRSGSSATTSSHVRTSAAPSRISAWAPWLTGDVTGPGTAITSRPSSAPSRAVISAPLCPPPPRPRRRAPFPRSPGCAPGK